MIIRRCSDSSGSGHLETLRLRRSLPLNLKVLIIVVQWNLFLRVLLLFRLFLLIIAFNGRDQIVRLLATHRLHRRAAAARPTSHALTSSLTHNALGGSGSIRRLTGASGRGSRSCPVVSPSGGGGRRRRPPLLAPLFSLALPSSSTRPPLAAISAASAACQAVNLAEISATISGTGMPSAFRRLHSGQSYLNSPPRIREFLPAMSKEQKIPSYSSSLSNSSTLESLSSPSSTSSTADVAATGGGASTEAAREAVLEEEEVVDGAGC
ncbi:hypothetical protein TYRP_006828 [Tyrophagus putrescentiae]|nr:hypothetical protein TYRP_006828 [Tyrophagus putrescentiae]